MNKPYNILTFLAIGFLAIAVLFVSCKKDDDAANSNSIELFSFGPSPALRGGELRVIGQNLDKVTAVVLPQGINVTTFVSQTSEEIKLVVPQETVEGKIILKTPQGDITSISSLTISEPIVLASFSPATVRAGDVLTITGDYLNLIKAVIFSSNVSVAQFDSQTREKLVLKVPEAAQSGLIAISNGEVMPIIVESETELDVTVPKAVTLTPNPAKAGTMLTIEGTDLDLTRQIGFEGTSPVTTFASQSATKIEVIVPAEAHDGPLLMIPGSFVEVPAAEDLVMVVPEITGISPNPVKNGQNITVTGIDLDLISRVTFGSGKVGAILGGGTATQIMVKVPVSATEDVVTFGTKAEKTVASTDVLQLVQPTVTDISPPEAKFGEEISINGNDMDLVASVIFAGGLEVMVNNATLNAAKVDVPIGATTGELTLVMKNGTQVATAATFTIALSTNSVITSMPSLASHGDMISIIGTDLDEINEVIFPANVPATMFGQKTATLIEVFVPAAAATGVGNIKFITFTGEEFFSPPINIQGVDPVDDPALVFFNFDGLDLWWGDTGGIENDPSLSLDGSNYFRANGSLSGWTGFFWRNGGDNFPGAAIGTNINGYALKFDINVLEPITGGILHWRLKGTEGDFWHRWAPWAATGSFQTNGWITVSIPLSAFTDDFGNGTLTLTDLSSVDSDFGVAFNDGDSFVNVCIDNVRFEEL